MSKSTGRTARPAATTASPTPSMRSRRPGTALSGRASGAGKTEDGPVEAIRVLVVAKRSPRHARVQAITQMRHLGYTTLTSSIAA